MLVCLNIRIIIQKLVHTFSLLPLLFILSGGERGILTLAKHYTQIRYFCTGLISWCKYNFIAVYLLWRKLLILYHIFHLFRFTAAAITMQHIITAQITNVTPPADSAFPREKKQHRVSLYRNKVNDIWPKRGRRNFPRQSNFLNFLIWKTIFSESYC